MAPLHTGTYLDGTLAVWSTHDYSLLTATTLDHPVHQAGWDPHTAYELTSVGGGLRFWLVEEDRSRRTCELKVGTGLGLIMLKASLVPRPLPLLINCLVKRPV